MADQLANNLVFRKDGITYGVLLSNEESIKNLLDINDTINTIESSITSLESEIEVAKTKSINRIIFCNEIPSDSIGNVNTLYLTRDMGSTSA